MSSIRINFKSILSIILFLTYFSIKQSIINPVYILALIAFCLFFLLNPRIIVKRFTIISSLFIFCITLPMFIGIYYQSKNLYLEEINLSSTLLFTYSAIIGVVAYEAARRVSLDARISAYRFHTKLFIIIMCIELIYRVVFSSPGVNNFYKYKHGFMHFDSNFTGMVISAYLCFCIFLKDKKVLDIGLRNFIILFLLLLFTFSRASIISFIITLFLLKFSGKFFYVSSVIGIFFTIFIISTTTNLYLSGYDFMSIDGSLNSKFYIISVAMNLYDTLPSLLKLTGIGLGNYSNYAGFFAHNLGVTLVFEFGKLGSLAFLLYIVYLYIKTKGNVMYLFLPIFICGFSLFSAYFAFFFVYVSLIYLEINSSQNH